MTEVERITQQLESVRDAISAIEAGAQEYTIDNRKLVKADLTTLYNRESTLETKLARLQGADIYFAELGSL